ncbi:A/G-specific adenine glycosylase [Pontibaca salina]|uniref:Adenine DNA glycosylase n=1 Tax=Pontibaca salina TaxID=2795731 RepID=A0A934HQ15_9RHOB|nr:A/G-specific adenine glycosylase [Pontibaca salina]MBI6629612.1 A/G-specific adenine glycosylase [Pontibaca salina]
MRDGKISETLLAWYDTHARDLPWRVSPARRSAGQHPDPYRVWLSEIMLQQTTVAAVRDYFHRFTALWPDVQALAAAPDGDVMGEWAGLGYYARARNLLKCARIIASEFGGQFPTNHDALLALPGIGPYTAAAISAIAFDLPETVMDGNVERVMARLFDVHSPLPTAKPELKAHAAALTPQNRPGDYAQAVMDLGATICTPRAPSCNRCPLHSRCRARQTGTAAELPKKTPKAPKPTRRGIVYLLQRDDGAWLLERRPDSGLLGGMLGWPGSQWGETAQKAAPIKADWQVLPAEVRHTFTHFHLILTVKTATVSAARNPQTGFFLTREEFRPSDLPTVMRKAYDLAQSTMAAGVE